MSKTDRLPELEGLRGVLSWWVVLGHIAYLYSDRLGDVIAANEAVHAFIILSGFVITRLLLARREPYQAFIGRRFARLFPAYALFLILSALTLTQQIDGFSAFGGTGARSALRLALLEESQGDLARHLTVHLSMLHGMVPGWLLPHSPYALMGQGWSVSLEWQFYLAAPLLVGIVLGGTRARALGIGVLAAILLLAVLPGVGSGQAFLPTMFGYFALGMGCQLLLRQERRRLLGPIVLLAMLAASLALRDLGLLAWTLVYLGILRELPAVSRPVTALLRTRPMLWLGQSSYSAYVSHMLIIYLLLGPIAELGLGHAASCLAVLALATPITLLVAFFSYHLIEQPFIRLAGRRKRPARSPEEADAAASPAMAG